jgi:hypothetical protein
MAEQSQPAKQQRKGKKATAAASAPASTGKAQQAGKQSQPAKQQGKGKQAAAPAAAAAPASTGKGAQAGARAGAKASKGVGSATGAAKGGAGVSTAPEPRAPTASGRVPKPSCRLVDT